MTRRDSLLALGTLATTMPFTLHAQEYKGALIIETDHEESRFKIGKDAFLLRPNTKIALEHDGVFTKALSLLGGGAMAVLEEARKKCIPRLLPQGFEGQAFTSKSMPMIWSIAVCVMAKRTTTHLFPQSFSCRLRRFITINPFKL